MPNQNTRCIGIDLGDSLFRISHLNGTIPQILVDNSGYSDHPSMIAFQPSGGALIGENARLFGSPENTVIQPITLLNVAAHQIPQINQRYVYRLYRQDGDTYIDAFWAYPSVHDVLTTFFISVKRMAEQSLRSPIDSIVIAIPDGFNDSKRIKVKRAAETAGFQVKQLLNQTTSAALGYRFDVGTKKRIFVVDVGASHTAFSIIEGGGDALDTTETNHCEIGVHHFQEKIVALINQLYRRETGYDALAHDSAGYVRREMMMAAEIALLGLSQQESVVVWVAGAGPNGKDIVVDVTRKMFEQIAASDIEQITLTLRTNKKIGEDDILLLIGGGAYIPIIRRTIDLTFKRAPFSSPSVKPSDAVALGAALKAGILDGVIHSESIERTVHDLGTYIRGNVMDVLIPRGTQYPYQHSKDYSVGGKRYEEKVYQWSGAGSGKNRLENERGMHVLGRRVIDNIGMTPEGDYRVRNTFTIDANGVAEFVITDLANGTQYTITGFDIR